MPVQRSFLIQLLFVLLLTVSNSSYSQDLIMVRVKQSFPETMVTLQAAIKQTGYTISRVQRVDIGLTKSGFKTDKYRVVFYGKEKEISLLTEKNADIAAFLPLKISIFAENNETIIVSNNPLSMQNYFNNIPKHYFTKWQNDIHEIFKLTSIVE